MNDTGILSKCLYNKLIISQSMLIILMYISLFASSLPNIGLTFGFIKLFDNGVSWRNTDEFQFVLLLLLIINTPMMTFAKIKINNLCDWSFVLLSLSKPHKVYYINKCNCVNNIV